MFDSTEIRALTFDVFGTVVDWRGSIIREGQEFGRRHGIQIDWAAFADAWRAGYKPAMDRVMHGKLPWTNIDRLHRMILDELLVRFDIHGVAEEEIEFFNRVWHRLMPWPDSIPGLAALRHRYVVASLSNGNMSLLVNMAKHANLPWDCVLSAELARQYKPAPAVYRYAAELLDLPPGSIMMVAAHNADLVAAHGVGFRTAFVARPEEYGQPRTDELEPNPIVDIAAQDFLDLARQLGA